MNKYVLFVLALIVCSWPVWAVRTIKEQTENSVSIIDLEYPLGFDEYALNDAVIKMVLQLKKEFQAPLKNDMQNAHYGHLKHRLEMRYQLAFKQAPWFSLIFKTDVERPEAAQPKQRFYSVNYYQDHALLLEDIFIDVPAGLRALAAHCREQLKNKTCVDAQWLIEGSEPIVQNYQHWSFHPNGLSIIFPSSQIAPFICGPFTVEVPFSVFQHRLTPSLQKRIWGKK